MDVVEFLSTVATVSCVLTALVMCVAYRYRNLQDLMVYHPNAPEDSTERCSEPSEFGMSQFETVRIAASDGVSIAGFFIHPPQQDPPTFTLVYFHGNAGNVGHRLPIAKLLVTSLRCSVLMMDYRGYGLSDCVAPSEEGLKLDAQATIDYVLQHTKVQKDKIFLLGTSLGGAVAIDVASRPSYASVLAGVVLENTFTSISDMADELFSPMLQRVFPRAYKWLVPFLKYVVKPIVLFVGWWSIDAIRKVPCPMLFLSGAKDELVPPSHIKRLHAVAQASKHSDMLHLVEFPNGKHNDLFMSKGYTQSIEHFVKDTLRRRHVDVV